jgi:acyl carrier protein
MTIDEKKFLEWCGQLFNTPVERLSMTMPRTEIEGWDSMGSLLLMADLDELYDIQIGEEGILELATLTDLANLIASQAKPRV